MNETDTELIRLLSDWAQKNQMLSAGAICVTLVVTRHASQIGLPLDAKALLSGRGGQILGLGKRAVQAILAEHGILRILAAAGGRTSRGNVAKMHMYVCWLNANMNANGFDLAMIERWWAEKAGVAVPFLKKLHFGANRKLSLRAAVGDLLTQAANSHSLLPKRAQASNIEIVLKHLVGAKLELVLGHKVGGLSALVSDSLTDRLGDFLIEDIVIHVTTSPGEALLRKCAINLDHGLRPLIITTFRNVAVADTMAENAGISGRVEIFDVEQFVASNILELSKFKAAGRRLTVRELIAHYNHLAECENNPALLIKGD